MMYTDLGAFVARLEASKQLVRVRTRVHADQEVIAVASRTDRALLFEQVDDHPLPLLLNAFGSEQRMAWALGLEHLSELNDRLALLLRLRDSQNLADLMSQASRIMKVLRPARMVTNAPVHEITRLDPQQIDVTVLPLLRSWAGESGHSLTGAQLITSHVPGCALDHVEPLDRATLGLHSYHPVSFASVVQSPHDGAGRVPVALVLGGDPGAIWASRLRLPPPLTAPLLAGWLRDKPLDVARAVTQPLDIPAGAEIVIEGWLDPAETETGGRFGAANGCYAPQMPVYRMHVTALTRRSDALCPALTLADHHWLNAASRQMLTPMLRLMLPEIRALHLTDHAALVSIGTSYRGQAQKVMHALWGIDATLTARTVVVLDDDIDLHDPMMVARRISETVDWRHDLTWAAGALNRHDPGTDTVGFGDTLGIDATHKPDRPARSARPPLPAAELDALLGDNWRGWCGSAVLVRQGDTPEAALLQRAGTLCPHHHVIVLDSGVDLDDMAQIASAISTRAHWGRDLTVQPNGTIRLDASTAPVERTVTAPDVAAAVKAGWRRYGIR